MNRGQGIIEILIAVSLITGGFLAGVVIFSNVFKTYQIMAEKITATYLASEGIELVKNIIDANFMQSNSQWDYGISDDDYELDINKFQLAGNELSGQPKFLYFDNVSGLYSYDNNGSDSIETSFTRKITINKDVEDTIKVISEVNWKIRNDAASTTLEAVFYNWRP